MRLTEHPVRSQFMNWLSKNYLSSVCSSYVEMMDTADNIIFSNHLSGLSIYEYQIPQYFRSLATETLILLSDSPITNENFLKLKDTFSVFTTFLNEAVKLSPSSRDSLIALYEMDIEEYSKKPVVNIEDIIPTNDSVINLLNSFDELDSEIGKIDQSKIERDLPVETEKQEEIGEDINVEDAILLEETNEESGEDRLDVVEGDDSLNDEVFYEVLDSSDLDVVDDAEIDKIIEKIENLDVSSVLEEEVAVENEIEEQIDEILFGELKDRETIESSLDIEDPLEEAKPSFNTPMMDLIKQKMDDAERKESDEQDLTKVLNLEELKDLKIETSPIPTKEEMEESFNKLTTVLDESETIIYNPISEEDLQSVVITEASGTDTTYKPNKSSRPRLAPESLEAATAEFWEEVEEIPDPKKKKRRHFWSRKKRAC